MILKTDAKNVVQICSLHIGQVSDQETYHSKRVRRQTAGLNTSAIYELGSQQQNLQTHDFTGLTRSERISVRPYKTVSNYKQHS